MEEANYNFMGDDGWTLVVPRVRVKKNREQKRLDQERNDRVDAVLAAALADMRPPPRPPKEKKEKKESAPEAETQAPVDADTETCKGRVISAEQRDKLQKMRTALGLTRAELARKINVIEKTVANYENGKGIYNPVTYNRMINALVQP